jgi:2-keto-4-pentenoate hydratase
VGRRRGWLENRRDGRRRASAVWHDRAICRPVLRQNGSREDARASGFSREDVVEAVDALVPAMEIVGPRFTDLLFGRVPTAIADNGINAGFVFGAPVMDWRRYDLPAHAVTLSVNGVVAAQGLGSAVLGDPIESLLWTVNHLSSRGISIEAGQIISTGTATGIVFLQPGDSATADFGLLGQVSLTFSA